MTQAVEKARKTIRTCMFCRGSGRCAKCDGHGTHVVRKGRLGLRRVVGCIACDRTGRCGLCDGKGTVAAPPGSATG